MSDVKQIQINMYDLLVCLTNAIDLISPEVADHHQQVSYLAFSIADRLGLSFEQKKDLTLAGLLHDVGALSLNERLDLIESEPMTADNHAYRGAWLLEGFAPLKNAANIIRYHHVPWKNRDGKTVHGNAVPDLSHILHLADRIAVQVDRRQNVLDQVSRIQDKILQQKNTVFMPEAVEAFMEISSHECLWLDVAYRPTPSALPDILLFDTVLLDMDELIDLTKVFAQIIDFRSPFTANHSAGVAKTAEKLAQLAGYSENECKMMSIAGNLHDLGKLAMSRTVLEKPDKLDASEISVIKSHAFYTYRLLQPIKGFEIINKWASFHHERLNGEGYPFHLDESSIPLGARVMAVADIFTAIKEDRPYRKGMSDQEAIAVLDGLTKDGCICPHIVGLLMDNYERINTMRAQAQEDAVAAYKRIVQAPIV